MKAEALTPADIFGYHVRYVVPLFQRPYVWNQRDQWEPLWADVRTVAERMLRPVAGPAVAPHFLGAIVVEHGSTSVGSISVYHVIDGQQRLTTLQLLLDAAQSVTERLGHAADAKRLRRLVLNEPAVPREDEEFKVWPSLADRAAFRAAMSNGSAPAAELTAATVVQAHTYFTEAITAWAEQADAPGQPETVSARLSALARALGEGLRAVIIHLDAGDNAQAIFETLNYRGARLLAADLIKNFVFRVAEAQQLAVVPLYHQYWAELDNPYWREYVKRGRQVVPRIDVFVNYWLVMRLVGDEFRSDRVFAAFRDHLLEAGPRVEELLADMARNARAYQEMFDPTPDQTALGRFRYRVFQAMDVGAFAPFYLWLLQWPAERLSVAQRDKALAMIESWVVRRGICQLPSKDSSSLVLDLLRELNVAGPDRAGDVTEAFLLRQKSGARSWPVDAAVRKALKAPGIDTRLVRPRLRLLLEAVEDRQRTAKSDAGPCERGLTVEHIMPVAWREHWAPAKLDAEASNRRDKAVTMLGNLTLVRWKLNSTMANWPWTDAEAVAGKLGNEGKRSKLRHSALKLNAELIAMNPSGWNEEAIAARTAALATAILKVWPRPTAPTPLAGAFVPVPLADTAASADELADESPVDDPSSAALSPASSEGSAAEARSKYLRLTDFLKTQAAQTIPLTFQQVEDVLGAPLPPTARTSISYWGSTKFALGRAISAGGFRATNVDPWNEHLIFQRRLPGRGARTDRYVRRPPARPTGDRGT